MFHLGDVKILLLKHVEEISQLLWVSPHVWQQLLWWSFVLTKFYDSQQFSFVWIKSIFVSADSCFLSVLYFHNHHKYPDVLDYSASACVWRERSIMELIFWFISWCCGHNFCREHEGSICCIQVLIFSIQLL